MVDGDGDGDGWLRRLAGCCWRHRRTTVLALGGSLLATAVTATVPLVQRAIIDDSVITHRYPIVPLAGALTVLALLGFGGAYLRRYRGGQLSLDVQHDLRTELFGSLSRLDGARQDELDTGQVVSRAISDLSMVQALLGMVPMMLGNITLLVLSLAIMLLLSPVLTLIALAAGPALWLVTLAARRRIFPSSWYAQQQAAAVAGVVDAAVTGVRVVKGFGQEEQELGRLEGASERLYAARVRTVRLQARFEPVLEAIPSLGQIGVLALGGWLALRGWITLGTFFAFSAYLLQLTSFAHSLGHLVVVGQQARASVIRVFEVIDSRPLVTTQPGATALPPDAAPLIEFDDVSFGYLRSEPVLRGLTLRVEPGETLAVVGASGSGKSTLSVLLPRFYEVDRGAVRVGGRDVRDVTMDSLRAAIGLVAEDSFLFSDSVRANIAYGRPDATAGQVAVAAQAAEADGFIASLPDGYDTVTGEQGLTLSGGQRQRVALARALITEPRILLLDDATSAVDPHVEAGIHAMLRRVMRGRTTLIIAHRRSTLQLADRIAVLDGGRVADTGTHEELTARCPLYRMLLGGPGGDAEGLDAGELCSYESPAATGATTAAESGSGNGRIERDWSSSGSGKAVGAAGAGSGNGGVTAAAPAGNGRVTATAPAGNGGVTAGLWDRSAAPAAAAGSAALAGGPGGGPGGGHGFLAGMPPSPELLARVAALPPARDNPQVDRAAARAGDPRFTLRRLLRPLAWALVAGLILDGLDALASLALPALVRGGIDNGVQAHAFHAVLMVSLAGLAIVLADWAVNAAETMVVGRNGERLLYTLRVKIFAHLQRLSLDYYERELSGRIMTRMTTDVDALSTFVQTGLITLVSSVLTFGGVLIALIVINLRLGLLVLSIMPVLAAATLVYRSKSSRAYEDAREKVSVVNAELQENVAGLRTTQAYRREGRNRARFARRSGDYRSSRLRAQRYIALYFPFMQFASTAAGALVLLTAAGQVRAHALTAGALIAYLLYIDMVFAPVQQLSQVFDGYQQAVVGLRRIRALLRTPTSTPEPRRPVRPGRLRGRVELRGVRFRYGQAPDKASIAGSASDRGAEPCPSRAARESGQAPDKAKRTVRGSSPAEREAIAGIDLVIEPGETVALVGETGAGKSTVVKLMARFYDVTSGAVLADGTDVRDFDLASYRQRLGVVPQEPYLFAGTVRDAIAYGRPDASDAAVEAAARAVGAHEMIAGLSGGYYHLVSERGRNLSAGQRQLLALARAQLVDPDILLLDEATAALDLASEAVVTRATEHLVARRTTVVVAHRLTTAARADRIVVLDAGRIVETGTHRELAAAGGRYAELWSAFTGETEPVA